MFQNVVFLDSYPLIHKDEKNPQLSLQREWDILEGENTIGRDVVKDNDQNIYVVGNILNDSTNAYDVVVYKYNSSGQVLWNVSWGGMLDDYAYALDINRSSTTIYVVGRTASYGINESNDIFMLSYDSSGILKRNITGAVMHGMQVLI